jgi:HEAT repeat protein
MPLFGPPNVQKLIDKRDLKKLAATLADGDSGTRDEAAQGARAMPVLAAGLVDAPEARSRLDSLVTSDGSLEVRGYAGFAMASHKVSGACETLLGQLGSDDAGSRGMAATNLGVLGDPRAAERLGELADGDPDQRVRDAAGKALASLSG